MSNELSELVQHQAEQYRKIQEYDRLVAENAKLREALQNIIDQQPNPTLPYARIVVEIAHEALSH